MSWNEVVMGFDYLYQEKTWKRDRRLGGLIKSKLTIYELQK